MAYHSDAALSLVACSDFEPASGDMEPVLAQPVKHLAFAVALAVTVPAPGCGGRCRRAEECSGYTWGITCLC